MMMNKSHPHKMSLSPIVGSLAVVLLGSVSVPLLHTLMRSF